MSDPNAPILPDPTNPVCGACPVDPSAVPAGPRGLGIANETLITSPTPADPAKGGAVVRTQTVYQDPSIPPSTGPDIYLLPAPISGLTSVAVSAPLTGDGTSARPARLLLSSDKGNTLEQGADGGLLNLPPDLSSYAKTSDLSPYAKTSDLSSYAKTADIPKPDDKTITSNGGTWSATGDGLMKTDGSNAALPAASEDGFVLQTAATEGSAPSVSDVALSTLALKTDLPVADEKTIVVGSDGKWSATAVVPPALKFANPFYGTGTATTPIQLRMSTDKGNVVSVSPNDGGLYAPATDTSSFMKTDGSNAVIPTAASLTGAQAVFVDKYGKTMQSEDANQVITTLGVAKKTDLPQPDGTSLIKNSDGTWSVTGKNPSGAQGITSVVTAAGDVDFGETAGTADNPLKGMVPALASKADLSDIPSVDNKTIVNTKGVLSATGAGLMKLDGSNQTAGFAKTADVNTAIAKIGVVVPAGVYNNVSGQDEVQINGAFAVAKDGSLWSVTGTVMVLTAQGLPSSAFVQSLIDPN